ncbi:mucin-2-like [Dorcoceras hygrometricum]|uniref:Mucin-2-like n=1 Tax=Dorcoceras hygrometricum TaxID=472368 RepID=A0A2Z7AFX1_9LAMI|nr:mucin-2-like [Dorcoceras hygrometricum]
MASSLFSNTIHVCFDSVLAMENAGMVAMFKALAASGLQEFLGCPPVIFETTLVEFFHNASVRDGLVVSTVHGQQVEISEEIFASTRKLPTEGLIDLHEVPLDAVLKARRAFSYDGKLISTSCKKRERVFEFRLLSDILDKSVTVKVGSFDAVTHERFLMMTDIFGGIKVTWSRLFFIIFKDMNWVKKTPVKRAVSKKRPAVAAAAEPVVKKKRTSKGKSDPSKDNMEIVPVAQESTVKATEADVVTGIPTADDVDIIIDQVIAETAQFDTDVGSQAVQRADNMEQCFKKLAKLKIEDIYAKEEHVLSWGEADSTRVALQIRTYILTKYKELLLWKFLETRHSNFVPGEATSAIDLKVLDMLSNFHLFVIEELKMQTQAHGLRFFGALGTVDFTVLLSTTALGDASLSDTVVHIAPAYFLITSAVTPSVQIPIASDIGPHVQLVTSSVFEDPSVQMDIDQRPYSPTTSADSSLRFDEDNIPSEDDAVYTPISLPAISSDFSASFADLRGSISQFIATQKKDSRWLGDSQHDILSKINKLEKDIFDTLNQQEQAHRSMIQSVRQETITQFNVLSIKLNDLGKDFRLTVLQSSQPPQQQQQVAQQLGLQRFRPRGKQFKKKSGSSSSGSGSSSSRGTKVEYCGQCGGRHPTAQCIGVQGSCNVYGQYGHFSRVRPLSGS